MGQAEGSGSLKPQSFSWLAVQVRVKQPSLTPPCMATVVSVHSEVAVSVCDLRTTLILALSMMCLPGPRLLKVHGGDGGRHMRESESGSELSSPRKELFSRSNTSVTILSMCKPYTLQVTLVLF